MSSPESKRIRAAFVSDAESADVPLEIQRQQWEDFAMQTPLPPNTCLEAVTAAGVACEWVRECGVKSDKVLLHLHGGGFTSGSPKTHRELAARLAKAAGAAVLLVAYRLAPEHPFPAAIEDTIAVYRWLIRQGTAAENIVISGDSAGGSVALSGLLALRESGDPLPSGIVLLSPWLDPFLTGESILTRATLDPLVSLQELQTAANLYFSEKDRGNPLLSPLDADLHGLPPICIHVGDHEILLSDSVRLAERAQVAGIKVQLKVWEEMWHVFTAWAGSLPEGQQSLDQVGDFIKSLK